jgi:hypothetical protein
MTVKCDGARKVVKYVDNYFHGEEFAKRVASMGVGKSLTVSFDTSERMYVALGNLLLSSSRERGAGMRDTPLSLGRNILFKQEIDDRAITYTLSRVR